MQTTTTIDGVLSTGDHKGHVPLRFPGTAGHDPARGGVHGRAGAGGGSLVRQPDQPRRGGARRLARGAAQSTSTAPSASMPGRRRRASGRARSSPAPGPYGSTSSGCSVPIRALSARGDGVGRGGHRVALARRGRWSTTTGPGWYRGDLHAHTLHSDGDWDVAGLIAFARGAAARFPDPD